jgi:hypothetical protein
VKRVVIGVLSGLLTTLSIAQSNAKATRAYSPRQTDGEVSDWTTGTLRFYDSNLKLAYDLANDDRYLYMIFQLDRTAGTPQMMKAGLQLTVHTKTKPKRTATIQFPTYTPPIPPNRDSTGQEHKPIDQRSLLNNDFLRANTVVETDGFYFDNGIQQYGDTIGILTAVNRDTSGNLFFELCIPLEELFENPVYFPADMQKPLELDISMLVVPPFQGGQQAPNGQPGGMRPPNGGGSGGERPSGPPPGGRNGGMEPPAGGMPGGEGMPSGKTEAVQEERKTITRKIIFAL